MQIYLLSITSYLIYGLIKFIYDFSNPILLYEEEIIGLEIQNTQDYIFIGSFIYNPNKIELYYNYRYINFDDYKYIKIINIVDPDEKYKILNKYYKNKFIDSLIKSKMDIIHQIELKNVYLIKVNKNKRSYRYYSHNKNYISFYYAYLNSIPYLRIFLRISLISFIYYFYNNNNIFN